MPSTLDDVLTAVASQITGLALEFDGIAIPVDVVKNHVQRDTLDDATRITVRKAPKPEKYTRYSFSKKRVDYFIEVTIQAPRRDPGTVFDPDKDLATHTDFRQRILDAFDKPPLSGATDVFDLTAEPLDFLSQAKSTSMWEIQGISITASIVKPF